MSLVSTGEQKNKSKDRLHGVVSFRLEHVLTGTWADLFEILQSLSTASHYNNNHNNNNNNNNNNDHNNNNNRHKKSNKSRYEGAWSSDGSAWLITLPHDELVEGIFFCCVKKNPKKSKFSTICLIFFSPIKSRGVLL